MKVLDSDGTAWTVVKVWDDGDVTLMDALGLEIDRDWETLRL